MNRLCRGTNSPWQYCGTGVSPVVFTVRNGVSEPLFSLLPRAAKLFPQTIEKVRDPSPTPGRGGAPILFILSTDPPSSEW